MVEPRQPAPRRLLYIDNLRWSAISMVVVMHAAVTYSPFGSWYYREHPALDLGSKAAFATYQSLQHAASPATSRPAWWRAAASRDSCASGSIASAGPCSCTSS